MLNELLIALPNAIAPRITATAIKLIRSAYSIAEAPRSAFSFEITFATILFIKIMSFHTSEGFSLDEVNLPLGIS